MTKRESTRLALLGAVVAAALCLPGPARAWEQRRNTLSFGVQGGVAVIDGTGIYTRTLEGSSIPEQQYRYEDFRWKGALGFRLRYSLDRSHAAGVSFEDLRFDRKSGLDEQAADEYQVNTVLLNYFVYFARRERLTPYLELGGGFHRDTFRFSDNDHVIPPLSPAASAGLGAEYFLRPAFSIDGTIRGYYLHLRGSNEWDLEGASPFAATAQIGVHYYLLK